MKPRGLSVIVVTWNCAPFIDRFVDELSASLAGRPDVEVLILDNASSDGTADLITRKAVDNPTLELVRSQVNLGFSRGNNILIRKARYETIALVNPDIFDFPSNFWTDISAAVNALSADVCFVKLLNEDGSDQDCIGEFPSLHRAARALAGAESLYVSTREPRQVEVGIMAFMYTTSTVLQEVGLLDEDYHMYLEDVDWCYRAAKAGKTVWFTPKLRLTHIGGGSSRSRWSDWRRQMVKYESEKIFITKHFTGLHRFGMFALLQLKKTALRLRARQ